MLTFNCEVPRVSSPHVSKGNATKNQPCGVETVLAGISWSSLSLRRVALTYVRATDTRDTDKRATDTGGSYAGRKITYTRTILANHDWFSDDRCPKGRYRA